MPETQFIFLEPLIWSRHQSLGLDMYVKRVGSVVARTRLINENHLKFIDPKLKLTLAHVARKWSRNRDHQNILFEEGVKAATGILSRTGVASEQTSVNHRYGAGTKVWAGFGAGSIHDPTSLSLHICFLINEATTYLRADGKWNYELNHWRALMSCRL